MNPQRAAVQIVVSQKPCRYLSVWVHWDYSSVLQGLPAKKGERIQTSNPERRELMEFCVDLLRGEQQWTLMS